MVSEPVQFCLQTLNNKIYFALSTALCNVELKGGGPGRIETLWRVGGPVTAAASREASLLVQFN